jgi:hypothetical protein
MKKKIKDLTVADFPGIDSEKFQEWKNAVEDANKNTIYALIGLLILNIILFFTTGSLILGGLLLALVFYFIYSRPRRLEKELGINRVAIRKALNSQTAIIQDKEVSTVYSPSVSAVSPSVELKDKSIYNTSGQGKASVVPAEIMKWNWGAFLLSWIWGIGNQTYIALLTLIPYVGFIMIFVLGVKGSEWAWKNKQWESIEHFQQVQKKWAWWGLGIIVGAFITGLVIAILLS